MFQFSKLLSHAAVIFLVLSVFFWAGEAFASEKINVFDVEITINNDASIDFVERIEYDFGNENKHGIFRTIPVKYKARGGKYSLRVTDVSVTDMQGAPYTFTWSKGAGWGQKKLRIGDEDKRVTGVKTYVVKYTVRRAINYFDSHDELYWNVTGDEWEVPINQVSVTVSLPKQAKKEDIRVDCFTGLSGSTTPCLQASAEMLDEYSSRTVLSFDQGVLEPNAELTVVVGVPKGIIREPSLIEKILAVVLDNWVIGIPVAVFIFLLTLWWKRGRDPEGRGTIVTQFDAPDDLTPSQVGTIIDERADNADLSADIVHLAVKGYLKINRIEIKKIFGTKTDYRLDKLRNSGGIKEEFERELLEKLFEKGKSEVKLSSLKNEFYKDLDKIRKKVYKSVVEKKYFLQNPNNVRTAYRIVGIAVMVVGDITGMIMESLIAVGSFSIAGIAIIGFSFIMPVKTKKGVLVKEHILGLKRYLSVAEKERLKFHNAPEKKPEHFDKLLPFAMVLGVEKDWAKQFEGIHREEPGWYSGQAGRPFVDSAFASDMNKFSASANSMLASRPSSAAGGGSGFSGGGAGGGFGGGGGGSW